MKTRESLQITDSEVIDLLDEIHEEARLGVQFLQAEIDVLESVLSEDVFQGLSNAQANLDRIERASKRGERKKTR